MQDAFAWRSGEDQPPKEGLREYVDEGDRRRHEEISHHGCRAETRGIRAAGNVELDLPMVQARWIEFARRDCEDLSTYFSARNTWSRVVGTARGKSCRMISPL